MSKLVCRCGYSVVDQTDFLPHKAEVLSDQDSERIWDAAADAIADFFAQNGDDARRTWTTSHLHTRGGADIDASSVVYQIMKRGPHRLGRTLYECSACGRLWLQARPGENRWVSYSPDEPGERGVLQQRISHRDTEAQR
jgi:hypothetical protein